MKFEMKFKVQAICKHFKNNEKIDKEATYNIELNIGKDEAANFIFRFAPSMFIVDDYKVIMRFDDLCKRKSITLVKGNNFYLVINMTELLSEILEGYIRIRTMEKIASIMEFDFETSLEDKDGIIDEFDLKNE